MSLHYHVKYQCLKATIENKISVTTYGVAMQQQGGYIEKLMYKLQDMTVTLDNY